MKLRKWEGPAKGAEVEGPAKGVAEVEEPANDAAEIDAAESNAAGTDVAIWSTEATISLINLINSPLSSLSSLPLSLPFAHALPVLRLLSRTLSLSVRSIPGKL